MPDDFELRMDVSEHLFNLINNNFDNVDLKSASEKIKACIDEIIGSAVKENCKTTEDFTDWMMG